jgi:hypothetical protein
VDRLTSRRKEQRKKKNSGCEGRCGAGARQGLEVGSMKRRVNEKGVAAEEDEDEDEEGEEDVRSWGRGRSGEQPDEDVAHAGDREAPPLPSRLLGLGCAGAAVGSRVRAHDNCFI